MEYDRVVTEFFLNTCRLRRPLNIDNVAFMIKTSGLVNEAAERDNELDVTPLSTGSVAEFYIEPMLSCIGDVDVMYHGSCELAIPQEHLPPTQLPAEFQDLLLVYEIIDSEYPGYVYLVLSYLLTEINDDGKYNVVHCRRLYRPHGLTHKDIDVQGPATVRKLPFKPINVPFASSQSLCSSDLVWCIRCLSWPLQAADWPTRQRNYGWPDSATVDRVVSNGCDVVCE